MAGGGAMEERGYTVLRIIGQGGQGRVYEVRDREGKQRVIKQLAWMGDAKETALREVRLLSSLRHPCIVPYLDSFLARSAPSVPDEDVLCLVMSRCEHDLRQMCVWQKELGTPFEESRVLTWLAQLCWGLQHLHARKFLHRDLKPQNVLLSQSGRVLIADFGVAGHLENSQDLRRSIVGTPSFMSPEMLEGRPYGTKTDQWALGCVLYEIMALEAPFARCTCYAAVVAAVLRAEGPVAAPVGYNPQLSAILMSLLRHKPHDRPSNTELLRGPTLRPAFHAFLQTLEAAAHSSLPLGSRPETALLWMRGPAEGGVSGPYGSRPDYISAPRTFAEAATAAVRNMESWQDLPSKLVGEVDCASYNSDFESYSGGSPGPDSARSPAETRPTSAGASDSGMRVMMTRGLSPILSEPFSSLHSSICSGIQEQTMIVSADLGAGEWRQLLAEAEALMRPEPGDLHGAEEVKKVRLALGEILGAEAQVDKALGWLRERRPLGETVEADEILLQVETLDLLGDEGLHALPLLERLVSLEALMSRPTTAHRRSASSMS